MGWLEAIIALPQAIIKLVGAVEKLVGAYEKMADAKFEADAHKALTFKVETREDAEKLNKMLNDLIRKS